MAKYFGHFYLFHYKPTIRTKVSIKYVITTKPS